MGRKKQVKAERERTDREKLELFLECCEELAQLEALRRPFGYNSGYTIIGTTLVEHKLDEPSDRDLRSVIGELRKFIADDSDIWLNRVHRIVYKSLRPGEQTDKYKADLGVMNNKWNAGFSKGIGRVTINGVVVSPKHAWDAWINGKYLHDDMDYKEELGRLVGFFREAHRAQFLEAALVTLNYSKWLYQNVAFFLN
jgi:hypothetical protein